MILIILEGGGHKFWYICAAHLQKAGRGQSKLTNKKGGGNFWDV